MNKKILYVNWGGLGDHLQFTTLPELFHNIGFEFFISDKSSFRSQEIYDLVWGTNPYVKGLSSEKPNCGHVENWGVNKNVLFDKSMSMHANIERIYDFDPQNDYPRIYYKPKNKSEYNDKIFVDLNAFSVANYVHEQKIILEHLNSLETEKIIFISEESSYGKSIIDFSNIKGAKKVITSNIFDYFDNIFSCKKFVSLWSGGSHLSVSIKKHHKSELLIDCLKTKNLGPNDWGLNNKSFFWYDNVNYIIC